MNDVALIKRAISKNNIQQNQNDVPMTSCWESLEGKNGPMTSRWDAWAPRPFLILITARFIKHVCDHFFVGFFENTEVGVRGAGEGGPENICISVSKKPQGGNAESVASFIIKAGRVVPDCFFEYLLEGYGFALVISHIMGG